MLKVLSLTFFAALAYASSVEITSPSPNDVWETGSTVQIKWKVTDNATNPLRIQYASGAAQALKIDGLIAHNVSASVGQYSWKIPKDVKPKNYVIEVGPSAKDLSFAGYIKIVKKGKSSTKKTSTKKHVTTKKPTKIHSTKKSGTKKTSTLSKKHGTKKHTTKKPTSTTTKKHAPKKTITKKPTSKKPSSTKAPVCVGYPSKDGGDSQTVKCHPAPEN